MGDKPDPLKKVTETTDLLGKIRGAIGKFLGYVERDQRREADKILRQTVSQRYQEQWERISSLQRQLIAESKLEYVDDLERAAIKLRGFIDKVKGASYGYAGLFDHVRIGEEELATLYQYDMALLENVDVVARAIENVEASIGDDGLPAAIRNLESLSQEVVDIFSRREETILEGELEQSSEE